MLDFLKNYKGYVFLLCAAFAYSSMPVLIRFLDDGDMPPSAQVFLRYIVSFTIALGYFVLTKGKFTFKRENLLLLLFVGISGYAMTNLLFTYSVVNTEIGNALFIFYSFGIIAPLLANILLKEKFNKYNWVGIALTLFGLLFLFRPNSFDTWKIGAIYALGSAISQSIYIVGRRKLTGYSSSFMLVMSTLLGIVSVGAFSLIFDNDFYFGADGIEKISLEAWLVTALMGGLNFTAWFLMSKGFEYAKATTGSLLLLIENVFAIMWGITFFSEVPNLTLAFGGFLVMLASFVVILRGK